MNRKSFEIGQRVVCVRANVATSGVRLKNGETYIVHGIQDGCCNTNIFVGFNLDPALGFWTRCGLCGEQIGEAGEWWHNSNRFVSIEEFNESEEAINELVEEISEPQLAT